jgi:hypothetical protein
MWRIFWLAQGLLVSLGLCSVELLPNAIEELYKIFIDINMKKFYVVPTLRLCVLCESQNKQQLLPYKTLRDWFL